MSAVRGFAGFIPAESGGAGGGGAGNVASVVPGTDIDVDATDPDNPVVSLEPVIDQSLLFNATPPFTCTSTQVATNLNADLLDGSNASAFAAATHTHAAADVVSGQLALARGGTGANLSATGGTGQVLKQATAGANITVGTLTVTDVTDIATFYQAKDAELTAIAGLTSAADKGIYFTGSGTAAVFDLSSAARTVLDDASVSAMVDTLGGASATGSGGLVRATSPTLVTPVLGTPTSGTLTNCTLPGTGLTAGVVPENTYLGLKTGLSADGKWCGLSIEGTAGAALVFGDLCYLAVADSRWELADSDAASTSGDVVLGICILAAAADGNATRMLVFGTIRADGVFPTLTVGAPAYVGTTAGDIQVAQPSGTDDVIRRVGWALTGDELFFSPSDDFVTHT